MPIEFHCPGCGKLMRTPDSTAGRKGQCPHCGTKVQIPDRSLVSSEPAAAIPVPASELTEGNVQGTPGGAASIRFSCSSCGRVLSVPASSAGKQGRCPGCGTVSQIPSTSSAATAPKSAGSPLVGAAETSKQFACPACKKAVRVPSSGAGGRGKCPHCGTILMMPGATPSGSGGLTPIPSGGLDDLLADLPNPNAQTQDPLGGFTGDPLLGGGAAAGGWSGGGFGGANPYAASFSPSRPRAPVHTNKPKRNGLPWDEPLGADSPFWSTVNLVLFSPKQAFYRMHRTGGLVRPLLFCVCGALIGFLATMAYNVAFQAISIAITLRGVENPRIGAIVAGMAIGLAIGVVVGLLLAIAGAVISAFLNGGLMHLCLSLVDGAEQPFETTFRVVCYTFGATAVCQILPICGPLFGLVANLVALVWGMYAAHETTGWKAAAGVLLPMVIVCAVCAMFVFTMYSTLSGMIPQPAAPTGG